jgi:hypothetical protein
MNRAALSRTPASGMYRHLSREFRAGSRLSEGCAIMGDVLSFARRTGHGAVPVAAGAALVREGDQPGGNPSAQHRLVQGELTVQLLQRRSTAALRSSLALNGDRFCRSVQVGFARSRDPER